MSLADKLDTFVSLSRAGERATGSRDPFGLRRQTQGAVRILMDLPELTGIDREIWLGPLLARAAAHAPDTTGPWTGEAAQAALAFAIERVRFALEHRGFAVEVVRAATPGDDVSPLRARRVAEAIQGMRASEDFQALAVLFKRVKNIAGSCATRPLDREALTEPAERALLEALDLRRPRIEAAVARSDYRRRLRRHRRPARGGGPVLHRGVRHGGRRAHPECAADAHGGSTRPDPHLADISEIVPQTE